MGKIFCMIGKSSTGKDSLFKAVLERMPLPLSTVVTYTTRPIRDHEQEGVEYHFTDYEGFESLRASGKVIEYRCYPSMIGDWYYFTVDDGQIVEDKDYLLIMTLEGYNSLVQYFGPDRVVPIYIEVEDGLRLSRALERERNQKKPMYTEMCRRFIADSQDFSEDHIAASGITKRYYNIDFDTCLLEICDDLISFAR